MINLTTRAHEFCLSVLKPGDVAIDATAGNGHDTLFLAQNVGRGGKVYSFDIQKSALEKTGERIEKENLKNVTLLEEDHSCLTKIIPEELHGQVAVIMLNLGYLPGGDKSIVTLTETTLPAIEQACNLLRPGGILSVLAYTGHPGGEKETEEVKKLLESLDQNSYSLTHLTGPEESHSPPELFIVKKLQPA